MAICHIGLKCVDLMNVDDFSNFLQRIGLEKLSRLRNPLGIEMKDLKSYVNSTKITEGPPKILK